MKLAPALLLVMPAQAQEAPDLLNAARTSYLAGDLEAAREGIGKARKSMESASPEDPIRYGILKQQYAILAASSMFADAEGSLQQAIQWTEAQRGAEHADVASDLTLLAMLARARGELDRGLAILDRVRQLHIKAGGIDCLPLADDFSRTAQFYIDKKDLPSAAAILNAALRVRQKHLGAEHVPVLPDLDRLAAVELMNREYGRAEAAYWRALLIREHMEGKSDLDLIQTLDGLAYSMFGQKKFDDAEPGASSPAEALRGRAHAGAAGS